MIYGGIANFLMVEEQREAMKLLGYPEYLLRFLGIAKTLGGIALLLPGQPLLKEWTYAGFTFDLLGAAYSHLAVRDFEEMSAPVILLLIAIASYLLRPSSRRLPQTICSQLGSNKITIAEK